MKPSPNALPSPTCPSCRRRRLRRRRLSGPYCPVFRKYISRIDLSREDFSLALAAPPDLSELSISSTIAEESFSAGFIPFVLAADPSGLLLVSDAYGHATDPLGGHERPAYFVWDAANVVTNRLLAHEEAVNHSGNVGFVVTPTKHGRYHDFTVAELLPVAVGESVTILCYDSLSCLWEKKTLPFTMPHYPWSSANVFSHDRKLWWVDLRHGILSCDPLADTPEVLFVPLPVDVATTTPLTRYVSKRRCVNLSDGKLRFVEMAGSARKQWVIAMWTLLDAEAYNWNLDYRVNLSDIWDDETYRETNKLTKKRPTLAAVHPVDPAVVYLLQKGNLFGVNLSTKRVVEKCVALEPVTHPNIDEDSSRSIITWDLPPPLSYSSGQMRGEGSSGPMKGGERLSTSAFDMIVKSFMNAYTSVSADLEFDELAKIAIAHLNRKIKREENKYRLSERLFLRYFDERKDMTSASDEYAHMNFYAQRDSKAKMLRQLVFAEFVKAAIGDGTCGSWTLLTCKTLTKNKNGGLYDTNVDVGQKRKRSDCFSCESQMKHPNSGFVAGHQHAIAREG